VAHRSVKEGRERGRATRCIFEHRALMASGCL
jgi:hypothetical protein